MTRNEIGALIAAAIFVAALGAVVGDGVARWLH